MSYLLTAVFENGFCELYLPSVDNKKVPLEIKPYISGRDDDIILPVEVWDGVWSMSGQGQFVIMQNEKPIDSITFSQGVFVNCEFPDGQVFSITVKEIGEGDTNFKKYLLNSGTKKITIGKNINKIGANAFFGCKNLKNIKFKTVLLTKKTVGKNAFKGVNAKAKAKVPKKVLKAYKKYLPGKGLNGKEQKITK